MFYCYEILTNCYFEVVHYLRIFFIQELFIWGKENVFFRKGDPYYSYKLQHLSNLTYTNLTYTNLNLSEFFTRYDLKYLNTNDFLRLSKVTKNFYSNVFFNKFFF